MGRKLEYYFDFLSPFSYFSWINLQELLARHPDLEVSYFPVLMSKLFDHWGQKGPAQIAPKRDFLLKVCIQYAHDRKIPFIPPQSLPFNPLTYLRMATLENCQSLTMQKSMIDIFWSLLWQQGNECNDVDALVQKVENAGFPGLELWERSSSLSVRKGFKANIKRALEAQLFGVPSFIYEGELFWGNDSLFLLNMALNGEVHYDKGLYNTFQQSFARGVALFTAAE